MLISPCCLAAKLPIIPVMTVVHPSDDRLERYVTGRLGAPGSPAVLRLEDHLFRCTHCVLKGERMVQHAQAMRGMIATLRQAKSA
jgi:hypothetical protein